MPTSTARRTDGRTAESRFERLAGWSYRRRWWALAAWVAVLVGVTVGSQALGGYYYDDFSLPGTESQQANETLLNGAPARAGDTVEIVLADPDGVGASGTRERVTGMLGEVRGLPHVAGVQDPYSDAATVSEDGTIGYATVALDGKAQDVPGGDVERIIHTAQAEEGDGLRVEFGGAAVSGVEEGEGGAAEGAGLLAALAC